MTSLAIGLFVIAVADLVPVPHRGAVRGATAGLIALVGGGLWFLITHDRGASVVLFFVLWIGAYLWVSFRTPPREDHRDPEPRPVIAVAAVLCTIFFCALAMPLLSAALPPDTLDSHLETLPWAVVRDAGAERVFLTTALLFFLGPASNGIVRSCLDAARTAPYRKPDEQLKGGRLIGPLERWLIFGLALIGEPTAAALLISAKSIIRFPELQSKQRRSNCDGDNAPAAIDELTEYFLLGSLLSWSLALAASLPLS